MCHFYFFKTATQDFIERGNIYNITAEVFRAACPAQPGCHTTLSPAVPPSGRPVRPQQCCDTRRPRRREKPERGNFSPGTTAAGRHRGSEGHQLLLMLKPGVTPRRQRTSPSRPAPPWPSRPAPLGAASPSAPPAARSPPSASPGRQPPPAARSPPAGSPRRPRRSPQPYLAGSSSLSRSHGAGPHRGAGG